jgi:hypothetical protein
LNRFNLKNHGKYFQKSEEIVDVIVLTLKNKFLPVEQRVEEA